MKRIGKQIAAVLQSREFALQQMREFSSFSSRFRVSLEGLRDRDRNTRVGEFLRHFGHLPLLSTDPVLFRPLRSTPSTGPKTRLAPMKTGKDTSGKSMRGSNRDSRDSLRAFPTTSPPTSFRSGFICTTRNVFHSRRGECTFGDKKDSHRRTAARTNRRGSPANGVSPRDSPPGCPRLS